MVMEFNVAWWVRGSNDEVFRAEKQYHSILAGRTRAPVPWPSGSLRSRSARWEGLIEDASSRDGEEGLPWHRICPRRLGSRSFIES